MQGENSIYYYDYTIVALHHSTFYYSLGYQVVV